MAGAAGFVHYDSTDFFELSHAFARLPETIRQRVRIRAMGRIARTGRTRVVRRIAERVSIPQKFVRERTSAYAGPGGAEAVIKVRSDWIPLHKFGARQTRTGVTVRARGSYRHAFIATMQSGHAGVFMRTGSRRLPIQELFGPNPANDVNTSPEVYEELLAEIAERDVLPRILHELDRALPG